MELLEVAVKVAVEDALLMGVLPIAQGLSLVCRQAEGRMLLCIKVTEDSCIVVRTDGKSTACEVATLLEGGACSALTKDGVQGSVVCLRRDDDYVLEVLCCPADEADTADVDLLDDVFFACARGYGSFEGVEVYNHQVDEGETVLEDFLLVGLVATACEDTALDSGV